MKVTAENWGKSKRELQASCEYCKSDVYAENTMLVEFDESETEIGTGKVYLLSDGKFFVMNNHMGLMSQINYCPMCGRKLVLE